MNCALHKPFSIKCTLKEGVRENETVVLTYRDEIVGCCLGTECNDLDKNDYQLSFKETDDLFLIYSYTFKNFNISDIKHFRVCLKEVNNEVVGHVGASNKSCLDVDGNIEACSSPLAIATPIPDVASLVPPSCNDSMEGNAGDNCSIETIGTSVSMNHTRTEMVGTPSFEQIHTTTNGDKNTHHLVTGKLSSDRFLSKVSHTSISPTNIPTYVPDDVLNKKAQNMTHNTTDGDDDRKRGAGSPSVTSASMHIYIGLYIASAVAFILALFICIIFIWYGYKNHKRRHHRLDISRPANTHRHVSNEVAIEMVDTNCPYPPSSRRSCSVQPIKTLWQTRNGQLDKKLSSSEQDCLTRSNEEGNSVRTPKPCRLSSNEGGMQGGNSVIHDADDVRGHQFLLRDLRDIIEKNVARSCFTDVTDRVGIEVDSGMAESMDDDLLSLTSVSTLSVSSLSSFEISLENLKQG